ncbi:TetR/AcrR family transcriptional regulator [Brevibacillus fluminis]|uniref:TetR/AcrR family transcriptional regulator n=1 Tax=Brevibacillus fluminis TaxID=511487 RepID=A0A3M8DPN4_9BACL|nr:TetR/AcrR family transcriptional regulator [Brevibacillus fluminis]RNB89469.1 TetR/AcrR family transcriptional regulator [Brevibacillus fluminis]
MSPRTKEQNEEIRKQRRQEILQAAILVYADKGYAASEIGEIAERAGLARGLVYHYFKSKQALFRELYEYMMDATQQRTKAHFEQNLAAFQLFADYARMVCRQVLDAPAISRFYTRISLDVHYLYGAEEFSPFEWMKSFIEPMTQAIERGIQEKSVRSGEPSLLAMQFWGAVSQGMHYLEQLKQELAAEGTSEREKEEKIHAVLEQVIESALAVIAPA